LIDRRGFARSAIACLALPLVVSCEEARDTKMRRIGVLSPNLSGEDPFEEFAAPLRELGWIEGKNLSVERRAGDGQSDWAHFAEELVRLNVELILSRGSVATLEAKKATTTIPIVMSSSADPVALGLVASLARPGGNVTGYASMGPEIVAKRAGVVHELLPAARRIAVIDPEIADKESDPIAAINALLLQQESTTYRSLGVEPIRIELAMPYENMQWDNAFSEAASRGASAVDLYIGGPPEIIRAASAQRLPIIVTTREQLEAGGLMYLEIDQSDRARRVAAIVDKILRGAKLADIPVEQPTRFKLGINVKSASALGITIPQSVVMRADEVIR
jgi:putative ABC transport system substrate-binding protein